VREYSTLEVAELAGLPENRVRRWARDKLINPGRDDRGRYRFSFQDLALLRTAARLFDAGLTPNRVTRSLRLIRDQLPEGRPLSAVRIFVTGNKVVVKDRLASWEPESRQGMFDFDVQKITKQVAPTIGARARQQPDQSSNTAEEFYESGIDLELAGRTDEAHNAYLAAVKKNPGLVGARINLGRLLHARHRFEEAESHYRAAMEMEPGNALAAFNLAVSLEDQGRTEEAVRAYQRTITIDSQYADAHFNLSRLLENNGDDRGALRHLLTFKRLLSQEN
jgi:tetratricopeptide (TPR) repeat protein